MERLLAVKDVAALLGVSARHVWRMNADGRLPPPVRFGRSIRWRNTDVASWIDAGCPVAPTRGPSGGGPQQ